MKITVAGQSDVTGIGEEDNTFGKAVSKRFIIIDHLGEVLYWNFPPRVWINTGDANRNVFDQLNAYFITLPDTTQQALFDAYKSIHAILRSGNRNTDDPDDLVEAIVPAAKKLFALINESELFDWVWNVLRPTIPQSSSAKVFDFNTMPGTPERTYLYDDYRNLIPLAIASRLACPFWFDFAELTQAILNPEHREKTAFSLVSETWFAKSKAMKRLELFVDHTVGNERFNPAAILLGIGSETFVLWTLSSVVIKSLTTVDILGFNPEKPVVSALYNAVGSKLSGLKTSQPSIKNKFAETSYGSDENNQSFLEGFRNRIELTVGQEAYGDFYIEKTIENVMNNSVRNPHSLLERVAPGIDYAVVKDALSTASKLNIAMITDQQINLASWLFSPYSQHRATGNFRGNRVLSLLGLAQAVLLHLDKVDLAMLVTAQCQLKKEEQGTHVIGESIAQLSAKEKDHYRQFFPLEKRSKNQRKVDNFVIDDVYNLVETLQDYDIFCSFSDSTLKKIQGTNPNRRYFLKRNTVTLVMEFVKYLAERHRVVLTPDEVYQKLIAERYGIVTPAPSF